MSILTINVEDSGTFEQIVSDFRGTDKQATVAVMRALNKTALWLRTQATREISTQRQVPQKLIRERLPILKASRNSLKTFIQISLQGIRAHKMGRLQQTAKGARAGKFMFDGAFVATMPSTGVRSVFRRKGRGRLPIREVSLPLQPIATEVIENILANKTAQRFETLFRHELNFLMRNS